MRSYQHAVAFLGGVLFAIGLGLSGMTDPAKIIGFLDIFGAWDSALLLVITSAVLTYAFIYHHFAKRRRTSFLGAAMQVPTSRELTPRLIIGAALFGMGWGLSGFCPGPALVSSVTGNGAVLVFLIAMSGGMLLHYAYERLIEKQRATREQVAGRAAATVTRAGPASVATEPPSYMKNPDCATCGG